MRTMISEKNFLKVLKFNPPAVDINLKESALLLITQSDLSQRGYKNLKKVLKSQGVNLPTYAQVQEFIKNIDVGNLERSFYDCAEICLSASSNVSDTLKLFVGNQFWYEKLQFYDTAQQSILSENLKELNPELYGNLDPKYKALFLRLTGDNFRASKRFPTEQISYSVLNNKELLLLLLHSPYGQFLSSLWRGSESRINVDLHTKEFFNKVTNLVKEGIEVKHKNGFEFVFATFCADLGFVKEVLGKCSSTSLYGCFYCKKKIHDWDQDTCITASKQSIKEMVMLGLKAFEHLGENPDYKTFTSFQHQHFGQ